MADSPSLLKMLPRITSRHEKSNTRDAKKKVSGKQETHDAVVTKSCWLRRKRTFRPVEGHCYSRFVWNFAVPQRLQVEGRAFGNERVNAIEARPAVVFCGSE